MPMDQYLAAHYGTAKTASAEDQEKQAAAELFLKLAQEENIDLTSMPADKVGELYNKWLKHASAQPAMTAKTAESEEEEEKKRLKDEAKKEHSEKKAAAEKLAEAEFLGRAMAHAYVSELRKIAEATTDKTAGELPEALRAHMAGKKDEEEKNASAIDRLAFEYAQELVKQAGLDPAQAAQRMQAAFTLDLVEPSTKVASAPNHEAAVHVRALELLERVGYPVTWT